MSDPSPIARLRPKKAFGQNFLVNEGAIATIVGSALASGAPRLLEIGPGPGVLTERIAAVELWSPNCALIVFAFLGTPMFSVRYSLRHPHAVPVGTVDRDGADSLPR